MGESSRSPLKKRGQGVEQLYMVPSMWERELQVSSEEERGQGVEQLYMVIWQQYGIWHGDAPQSLEGSVVPTTYYQ